MSGHRITHEPDRRRWAEGGSFRGPSGPERYVVALCGSFVPIVSTTMSGASMTCSKCMEEWEKR